MNKKIAIAMASNAALALLMTTGCHSLSAGRTAFGDKQVDPYEYKQTPEITIETRDDTTQITPTEVKTTPVDETSTIDGEYVPPTITETSPSYQKYIVPVDYKNPTEGLKPVDKLPNHTTTVVDTTADKPEDQAATTDEFFTYTVKSGDCLSVIANSNGVRTKELAELNGLKPDAQVRIGQKLKVPAGRKPFSSTRTTSKNDASVADGSVYVVKSGDCLSIIAQNLNVKTADLMAINNLKNANSIYVGQKLKLPGNVKAPANEKETKVVKPVAQNKTTEKSLEKKDTITPTTANTFSLDQKVETIVVPVNEKKDEIEKAADKIIIPPPPVEAEEEEEESAVDNFDFNIDDVLKNFENSTIDATTEVIKDFEIKKVTKGETLDLIAVNYNTTVEALCELNGYDSTKKLKVGEAIKVPKQSIK